MAGGPHSFSTSPETNSPYMPGCYSSNASSPPSHTSTGTTLMSTSSLVGSSGSFSSAYSRSTISPIYERRPADKMAGSMLSFSKLEPIKTNPDMDSLPTIFIRKLPRGTSIETLRSMLLFAKDLIEADFVTPASEYSEDYMFASAIARFKTAAGAHEAKERLNGKPNATGGANMIVEIIQSSLVASFGSRRHTIDATAMRHGSISSTSMPGAPATTNRQSSRYNGTFQSYERLTPPSGNDTFPQSEFNAHNLQGIFSPKSPMPIGTKYASSTDNYTSSKAMINDDTEDETGKILANPVEFAMNGEQRSSPATRRPTNSSGPLVSSFSSLSLNTTPVSMNGFPRGINSMQSPASGISPHTITASAANGLPSMSVMASGPPSAFPMNASVYQRVNYPPANPADQNPPCNTLYVGNLPLDTSEDELKAMFSKQRGYKRLCFRTKQNGPMCFVEFEDVSFATKALHELYGHPLHNSVKGGIRLSFSKNPLGVRTGQTGAHCGIPGPGGMGMGMSNIPAPPGFSKTSGPPPGLGAPPGLNGSMSSGAGMGVGGGVGSGGGMSPGGLVSGGGMAVWGGPLAPFGATPSMRSHSIASGMTANAAAGAFPGMGGEYGYILR